MTNAQPSTVCSRCRVENPPQSRFCGGCGSSLGVQCPQCGAAAEADQRFCRSCAAPLAGSGPPEDQASEPVLDRVAMDGPVAERRTCSVLFADLVGFTPISEQRDAEEVRELLSRYFDTARAIIARYGGVVEKFIGDAVMAVWGAPVASEGDTERAVRAGLDLVDAVAALASEVDIPELALRVGITTGVVAVNVGAVGEGMVAGDAVNTAARIQGVAAPGSVCVDEATRRLAEAAISFEAAGERHLKGKAAAVSLWQATRVLAGVGGLLRIDGLEAPLLGRDAELRTIKEMFHATDTRRTPRLVVVTGPVGVGKSRLGWEFEKYVDGLRDSVLWHRAHCRAYGDDLPFRAVGDVVRQRLEIPEDLAGAEAAARLAAGVAELFPEPGERTYVTARLAPLLGAALEGESGGPLTDDELFAGWRLFFERLAARSPVAILLEDTQHADAGLLDFVDHLVSWAADVPIFVLVFARPELLERRPGFGSGRNRITLALDPLDASSMEQLLEALVPGMPDAPKRHLVARAQGNPLFAVETIRSLIDRDVVVPVEGRYRLARDPGELSVPESLRGLLASRLDALGPDLRSVAAKASVLGSTFQADAVAAVCGRPVEELVGGLRELARREIFALVTDPLSPERGSYRFTQEMLRDVVYETLSRRDRKALHLRVVEHLASTAAEGRADLSEMMAQHYLAALDAVPAAPDAAQLRELAIDALVRAAEGSARTGSPRSAAASYQRAAEVADAAADTPSDQVAGWWERAADAAVNAGLYRDCERYATRAIDLLERTGDSRAAARCRVLLGRALGRLGRHTEAHRLCDAALDVLRTDADGETVRALAELSYLQSMGGDPAAAGTLREALSLAQALDGEDGLLADLFISSGLMHGTENRRHEAQAAMEYAARLAERADNHRLLGLALINLADMLAPTDPARAAEVAERARQQARRAGHIDSFYFAAGNLAVALIETGEWARADQVLGEASEGSDAEGKDVLDVWSSVLAAVRGDVTTARGHAALPMFRASEDPQDQAQAALVDAVIAQAEGRAEQVLAHCRSALRCMDLLGVRHECVRWSWPMAVRAARDLGDDAEVTRLLDLVDGRPPGHLPPILVAERKVAHAARLSDHGDPGADDAWADALAAHRRIGRPYNLALALRDRAGDLLSHDRRAEARPLLAEAREICERLGCPALLGDGAVEDDVAPPALGGARWSRADGGTTAPVR